MVFVMQVHNSVSNFSWKVISFSFFFLFSPPPPPEELKRFSPGAMFSHVLLRFPFGISVGNRVLFADSPVFATCVKQRKDHSTRVVCMAPALC